MVVYTISISAPKENKTVLIGEYFVYSENNTVYDPCFDTSELEGIKIDKRLSKRIEEKKRIDFIEEMISLKNRVKGKKKHIYKSGIYTVTRKSNRTDMNYIVYKAGAEKGQIGYSDKDHSCPHTESGDQNQKEWARWYSFHKMDDGTYEVELDEAWYYGGPYLDGGTITREIPEEWHELQYDEFLEKVITLARANHYKFTAEDLKKDTRLKNFFGFEDQK